MSLEQIVRPGQTATVTPPYAVAAFRKAPATPDPTIFVFGKGDNDAFLSQGVKFSPYTNKSDENEEIKRKYDTIRIKSKDDPDTYIDTEVMTEWQARNQFLKSHITLRFFEPESGPNVEVIRRGQWRTGGE